MRFRLGVGCVAVVAAAAVAASCSNGAGAPTLDAPTRAPANATVVIGERTFTFTMTCYAPEAGAVLAVGPGAEVATGDAARAVVRAFAEGAYVSVALLDADGELGVLFEPRPAEPPAVSITDDVVHGEGIRFVTDLDLATGTGTAAGEGTVTVACAAYEPGLPPPGG